jgi:hypothetical protein
MEKTYAVSDISAPKITLNLHNHSLSIVGNFNMLNCNNLLNEVIKDILSSEFGSSQNTLQVIIEVNHFNAKCIIGLVSFLKIICASFPVEVVWRYKDWDIDHLELGEIVKSILGVPFKTEEIDCSQNQ